MLARIRRFRRQLQNTVGPRGPGRRYPQELRAEAVEILTLRREAGASLHAVAEELGIPMVTLKRWAGTATPGEHAAPAFRPVTLHEQVPAPRPVLVLPSGARVEGLDVAGLVDLIQRLG